MELPTGRGYDLETMIDLEDLLYAARKQVGVKKE